MPGLIRRFAKACGLVIPAAKAEFCTPPQRSFPQVTRRRSGWKGGG